MRTYRDFEQAINDMPKCLVGSSCDDAMAIKVEATKSAEKPICLLRDLVRTELDLIAEGEAEYNMPQQRIIKNYYERLSASC